MVMSIVCARRSRWWEGVVGTMLTSGNGSMVRVNVNGDGNEMRKMRPEESRGGAAHHKTRGN